MEERIGLSLLARILDIILYDTLHRLMGQKSLIFVGFFILRMRAIFVLFKSAIGAFELRILRIVLDTSSPIIS